MGRVRVDGSRWQRGRERGESWGCGQGRVVRDKDTTHEGSSAGEI